MEVSNIRVGDVERSAVIDRINDNHAHGRLSATEAEVRVGAALEAQTIAELHVLTLDLPRQSASMLPDRHQWWQHKIYRLGFPTVVIIAGSVATSTATDSPPVGVISLIAGTCCLMLGRFSKSR